MIINTKPIIQKRNLKSQPKKKVVVHRVKADPKLQEKSVTQNGTIIADEGYDGLSKVNVNVSGGGRTAEALSVTENGIINTPDGKYYDPITVNVSGGTVYGQKVRYLYAYKEVTDSGTSIVYTTVEGTPTDTVYYYDGDVWCLAEAPIFPEATYTRVTEYDIDFGMEIATVMGISGTERGSGGVLEIVSPKATPEIGDTVYLLKDSDDGFSYLEATEFTEDYTINAIVGETVFEYRNALYAWSLSSESTMVQAYTPKQTPSVGDKLYYFSDYFTLRPHVVKAVSPDGSIIVDHYGDEYTLKRLGAKDLKW